MSMTLIFKMNSWHFQLSILKSQIFRCFKIEGMKGIYWCWIKDCGTVENYWIIHNPTFALKWIAVSSDIDWPEATNSGKQPNSRVSDAKNWLFSNKDIFFPITCQKIVSHKWPQIHECWKPLTYIKLTI